MKRVFISTMVMRGMLSNYGTFLQHMALREVVRSLDFTPIRWMHKNERTSLLAWWIDFLVELIHIPYWILLKRPNWQYLSREIVINFRVRCKFRKEYQELVAPLNESQNITSHDICLMGSDQILLVDSHAWYSVAPKECKRIIYAGSTDWNTYPKREDWRMIAKQEFPKFSYIYLREMMGVDICRKYLNAQQIVGKVVDPTMMVKKQYFDKVASKRSMFNRSTLFCYLVNVYSQEALNLNKYEKLAQKLGCELRILGTQGTNAFIPRKYRVIASPSEFLACYRDAKYVITNSFHGSIFSILYKKQFICVKQTTVSTIGQNIRQEELLSEFLLDNRLLSVQDSGEKFFGTLIADINWQIVFDKLLKLQTHSYDLLEFALKAKHN